MSSAAGAQLAAFVAGHGCTRERETPVAVPAGAWDAFVHAVVRQRIGGLAVASVDAGELVVDDAQHARLVDLCEQQFALDLKLERLARTAARLLDAAGIDFRLLKGPAVARLAYPRPELRSFADVDLLLPGDRFDDAVEVLCDALAFGRRFEEPHAGFTSRFAKGVCLSAGDGLELDLHRTLAAGPYGATLDVDALFAATSARVVIGDVTIPALNLEHAFVHACLHAVLGGDDRDLVSLRDVVALAEHGADAGAIADYCGRSRVGPVVRLALERAATRLRWAVPTELATHFDVARPSRFDRWALSTYERDGAAYAAQAAATFWVLPSIRDRAAYARALVWPDDRYLRTRDRGHLRRLSRSASLALRWRPR
jgi:hypothetical protein